MNYIIQWIAPTVEQLITQAEKLKIKFGTYGIKIRWSEPVPITEMSETRHDRVKPYDGFLIEVVLEKGEIMDWRERLQIINTVAPEYRHYTSN